MIVREILENPSLIDNFDWFNDGKDTIHFLKGCFTPEATKLAEQMESKLQLYHLSRLTPAQTKELSDWVDSLPERE